MLHFVGANPLVRWSRILWMACIALVMVAGIGTAQAQDDFLDPDDAFVFSAAMATPERLDVHFKVAPDYYMYRDRLQFRLEPAKHAELLGAPSLPDGLVQYDPTFDEDLEVYYDQYTFQVPIKAGAGTPLTLTIVSQGCADAGLCYTPTDHVITLEPTHDGYTASGDGVVASVPGLSESTSPDDYPKATDSSSGGGSSASGLDLTGDAGAGNAAMSSPDAGSDSASQPATNTASDAAPSTSLSQAISLGDTGLASWLANASLFDVIVLSVLFGLLLSFTPCVLPMVPILLAILAGGSRSEVPLSRWRGLTLAAAFVLGMSLVYTVLGVAAGLVGASLAAWLQTPWVLTIFAVLLALFALAMFDVFTLQVPAGLQSKLNERLERIPGGRYSGVFVMGMVSALIVGPCVAAPLAGVLLFISQTGDVVLGGASLFAMAWGEGLLLLAVGASSGVLLPRAGAWMEGVKHLFGILLLATALWMVNSIVPGWLMMLGWAFLALISAVLLGVFRGTSNDTPASGLWATVARAAGVGLAIWAVLLIIGVAAGGRDVLQPLKPFTAAASSSGVVATGAAGQGPVTPEFVTIDSSDELDHILANTDQPVMLDFYADWCVSCIQMEKFTFSDPAVAQRMGQFTLVQADVTRNDDTHRALLKRFNLFGPPGIIFFESGGDVIASARVVGFQNADKFAAVLDGVLAR